MQLPKNQLNTRSATFPPHTHLPQNQGCSQKQEETSGEPSATSSSSLPEVSLTLPPPQPPPLGTRAQKAAGTGDKMLCAQPEPNPRKRRELAGADSWGGGLQPGGAAQGQHEQHGRGEAAPGQGGSGSPAVTAQTPPGVLRESWTPPGGDPRGTVTAGHVTLGFATTTTTLTEPPLHGSPQPSLCH